jgi:hypothetical protein
LSLVDGAEIWEKAASLGEPKMLAMFFNPNMFPLEQNIQ